MEIAEREKWNNILRESIKRTHIFNFSKVSTENLEYNVCRLILNNRAYQTIS